MNLKSYKKERQEVSQLKYEAKNIIITLLLKKKTQLKDCMIIQQVWIFWMYSNELGILLVQYIIHTSKHACRRFKKQVRSDINLVFLDHSAVPFLSSYSASCTKCNDCPSKWDGSVKIILVRNFFFLLVYWSHSITTMAKYKSSSFITFFPVNTIYSLRWKDFMLCEAVCF